MLLMNNNIPALPNCCVLMKLLQVGLLFLLFFLRLRGLIASDM